MTGENTYIKGMELQLQLINTKVQHDRIKASEQKVVQKLEKVNDLFNTLRQSDIDHFEEHKVVFEKALNELSQLVVDNSELGRNPKT
jgi:hypothetical protein